MSKPVYLSIAALALCVAAWVALDPGGLLRGPALPPMPDGPVVLQNHELAPTLRRRAHRALEEAGLPVSINLQVTVDPAACPAACAGGMERGLCYCRRNDAGVCGAGWPLEQGSPRSLCASLPETVLLHGPEIDAAGFLVSF